MLREIVDMIDSMGIPFDYILDSVERIAVIRAYSSYNAVLFEAESISGLYDIVKKKNVEVDLLTN